MSTLHFWPEDIASDLPASPVTILKEAAKELGQATKGGIEAVVKLNTSRTNANLVYYDFTLVSKSLGFTYPLFGVSFKSTQFYPCNVGIPSAEAMNTFVNSGDEMREKLAEFLRSEKTVTAVKTLLAQSVAA